MATITTKLLFDKQAGEAAMFYTSLFKNSKIALLSHYPEDKEECKTCGLDPGCAGEVMNADFELAGKAFTAINGKSGEEYAYNRSISLFVQCEDEQEIDHLWDSFSEEGTIIRPLQSYPTSKKYGCVQDRFGVFWQLNLSIPISQKISPMMVFSGNLYGKAMEAIKFYTSIFEDSELIKVSQQNDANSESSSPIKFALFSLSKQPFMAMDSEEELPGFTEAISSVVMCKTQEELDYFWQKLSAGGDGFNRKGSAWLQDKYGVWWQLILTELSEMMRSDDETTKFAIDEMNKSETIDVRKMKRKLKKE